MSAEELIESLQQNVELPSSEYTSCLDNASDGVLDAISCSSSSDVERAARRNKKRNHNAASDSKSSVVVTNTVMATCAVMLVLQRKKKSKASGYDSFLFASPFSFKIITDFYGPEMFRKTFRMSRPTFEMLLSTVPDLLDRRFVVTSEYRRKTIPADIRLAIILRILAGASYCDLCLAYQVKESSVTEIFKSTCDALDERLGFEGLLETDVGLHNVAKGFQTSRPEASPLYACVGALDGICVKIEKPAACENPATFYSRKGFYALPVQALCDSNYIFRYCSSKFTGATHDALAYAVSGLKEDIDSGILGTVFYIIGDEAYVCTEELITRFRGDTADFDQHNFNYFLSSLRIHIEQAFGMLVVRWRILRGGLEYSVSRSADIVCLLMKLYTFCITYDTVDSTKAGLTKEQHKKLDEDVSEWQKQTHEIAEEFRSRQQNKYSRRPAACASTSRKRDALVAIVKEKNMRRPNPIPLTV